MSMPPSADRQRVAGIDYGTVRIGIALATTGVGIASPYDNYNRRGEKQDARYFRDLATQEKIDRFVVGLPVHLSGDESQKSTEAREFGRWLTELTGVPVEFYDERFTSAEAEQFLLDSNLTSKQRKARLDKLAAQIMLASYLESGGQGQSSPGAIDD